MGAQALSPGGPNLKVNSGPRTKRKHHKLNLTVDQLWTLCPTLGRGRGWWLLSSVPFTRAGPVTRADIQHLSDYRFWWFFCLIADKINQFKNVRLRLWWSILLSTTLIISWTKKKVYWEGELNGRRQVPQKCIRNSTWMLILQFFRVQEQFVSVWRLFMTFLKYFNSSKNSHVCELSWERIRPKPSACTGWINNHYEKKNTYLCELTL